MGARSRRYDAEIPHAGIADMMRDAVLHALTELSLAAKAAGNSDLMSAANRASKDIAAQRPCGPQGAN
jgi:hypothetical protein